MRIRKRRRERRCLVCHAGTTYDLCRRCTQILRDTEAAYDLTWADARKRWEQWCFGRVS